jgi:hypothetical protein
MRHAATDVSYLIAGFFLFPAVFIAAFMWLEWRGLGIASLATTVAAFLFYIRLKDQPTDVALRSWKRLLLIAGALLAAYALIASVAVLANTWQAVGLLGIASVLFFAAIFFTLTVSFVSGLRAVGTQKRLFFWLVPQGALLAACVITLLIAD